MGGAQAEGLQLTGERGLLQITKRLLKSALEGEGTRSPGYDRHDPAAENGGNFHKGNTLQDGADRGQPRRDCHAPRPGQNLRTEDRDEAAATSDQRRRDASLQHQPNPRRREGLFSFLTEGLFGVGEFLKGLCLSLWLPRRRRPGT